MKIFAKYYDFLKDYCKESSLNYDKIISYRKCGNKQILHFMKYDPEKEKKGC